MERRSSQDIGEVVANVVDEDLDERGPRGTTDVWKDQGVLHCLQHGEFLPNILPQEKDRIAHRMVRFHWEGGLIFYRWPDGTRKVVPRPDQRLQLIQQVHEELSHFGVRHTHSMLRGLYWWIGMQQEVETYVGRYEVCDRVRLSFNTLTPQLRLSPIMGLGYKMTTSRGAKYVVVMVEHFSKWIELVALLQNSSELAAAAFLDPPMAQALPIAQTTHANVPACNPKEPKFIMLEKFDGNQSKFLGFVHRSISSCSFILLIILMTPRKWLA
jgi:hypothetical protein